MPKIIKNLPELIVRSAKYEFEEHGYQKVDMLKISKRAGIAVGTIYNYYPNKARLFLDTVKLSWNEFENNLDQLKSDNPREKLKTTIKAYYHFGKQKKGLWEDIIQAKLEDDKKTLYIRNVKGLKRIVDLIIQVLHSNNCLDYDREFVKRTAINIIMTIDGLLREKPDEEEENYNYLYNLIDRHLDYIVKKY